MQDMMKNFMGDMWKGVGDIKAENWMKDLSPIKDMVPKEIGLQVLGFQKNAFDTIYAAMQQTHRQVEKLTEPLLKIMPGVPNEWKNMLKKIRKTLKKLLMKALSKLNPKSK